MGELNNPDYFAQRLTAKGDVGIFDDRKILQKYFNLGDLTAEEKIIQPQIHDFVYETLFFGKEGESKAERQKREQYLKEFKENYFQFYDDDFFKKTGVRFNNLDFKEQSWFLIYYKNANDQKKDILLDFVKVHGENGLKTFLSLENGEEMGDRILAIGKDIDSISAGLIFNKYAEIVDSVGTIREEVDGLLKSGGKSISSEQIELISQNLISRANRLLVDFSKRKNEGGIVDQLENYRLDLVLSAAFFKVLKQSGAEIKPEDFKGVAFESKATAEISPEELAQMLKIYEDNYSVNHKYSDEHRNKLVNDFKEKIQSRRDDVVVYMCKMDEKIIVFNAFEDSANTNRRGTAFNAIKPVEGSPFAKEFLERSLGKEMASGRTVEVDCDPRSPMSEYYVDRGFIVKGMADKYPGTGELVLNIEISANNQNYDYRKCSREQIIADQGVYTEGAAKTVLKFQIDGPEVLNEFMGKANGMADKGYVITRYVFSDDRKSVYCAFEKSRS